jgi:hypothetical protein
MIFKPTDASVLKDTQKNDMTSIIRCPVHRLALEDMC